MIDAIRWLALSGGDWVIYLLLASSVLALAVVIERWVVLSREAEALDLVRGRIGGRLADGDWTALARDAQAIPGAAARVLAAGLSQARHGSGAAEETLASAGIAERRGIERRLLILGTLGNNAPFIGLFGTVLGVIKAFHDLAQMSGEGPEVAMRGLSQALVATAVGLFVAIPSVVAYNYFQSRVKDLMSGIESLNRALLARIKSKAGA